MKKHLGGSKRREILVATVALAGGLILLESFSHVTDLKASYMAVSDTAQSVLARGKTSKTCKPLNDHESGQWVHHRPNLTMMSDEELKKMYYPEEIDWLRGRNWPSNWGGLNRRRDGVMYGSGMGNQKGGAGVDGFEPSHSEWVYPRGKEERDGERGRSPTVKLIKLLAERKQSNFCFAGDSVDYQLLHSLRNNLQRQQKLQSEVTIEYELETVPVRYTRNETGLPPHQEYTTMSKIESVNVTLNEDGAEYHANFRYFQMVSLLRNSPSIETVLLAGDLIYQQYGWSPWDVHWMKDCDVVSVNLGVHYSPTGNMYGKWYFGQKLWDDTMAAITYLVEFVSAKPNRVAVWR